MLMGSSIRYDTIKLGWFIVYIEGSQVMPFRKKMNCFFCFTNSVDPDEMQHYAAFHLGLHSLSKNSVRVSSIQRVTSIVKTENVLVLQ